MRQPIKEIDLPEANLKFFLKDEDVASKIHLPSAIERRRRDGSKINLEKICELEIFIRPGFPQNQIPTKLTFADFESLSTCKFEVVIKHNVLSVDSFIILDGLPGIRVTKLSVRALITPTNFSDLARFIKKSYQHLKELDISNSMLSSICIRDLFLKLPEVGLTELNLQLCSIGTFSAAVSQQSQSAHDEVIIREIFTKFPFLKILNLSKNPLRDEGFEALSKALKENTVLEVLDISHIGIRNQEVVVSLAAALSENLSLKELIITINSWDISRQPIIQAIMDAAYISNGVRKHFDKEPLVIKNITAFMGIRHDLSEDRRRELGDEIKESIKKIEEKVAQYFGVAMDEDLPKMEAAAADEPLVSSPALAAEGSRRSGPSLADEESPAKLVCVLPIQSLSTAKVGDEAGEQAATRAGDDMDGEEPEAKLPCQEGDLSPPTASPNPLAQAPLALTDMQRRMTQSFAASHIDLARRGGGRKPAKSQDPYGYHF